MFHLWADTEHWSIDPGSVGVVGFFALSGFLITGLLIKEHEDERAGCTCQTSTPAVPLAPSGVVPLPWCLVPRRSPLPERAVPLHRPECGLPRKPGVMDHRSRKLSAALLYVTNWLNVEPSWHLWYGYSPISHLWTLAVEEQFYVLWAPVMLLLLRLRLNSATLVAAAIAVIALAEPVFFSSSGFNRVYFGTDTRCAALFCGAFCAFVGFDRRMALRSGGPDGLRCSAPPLWASSAGPRMHCARRGTAACGTPGSSCAVSCAHSASSSLSSARRGAGQFLSSRSLVAIGKRSYALYLWSYVLNTWLRDTGFFESFLVIGLSFLAAETSYRFVELPALRYKHHFMTATATEPEATKSEEKALARR